MSIIKGERNENIEMQEKVYNVIASGNGAKVFLEFEQSIWLRYHPGQRLKKLKKENNFLL